MLLRNIAKLVKININIMRRYLVIFNLDSFFTQLSFSKEKLGGILF